MADAFRPDGKLNIPTQAAADYIADQGQIIPYERTLREKTRDAIADFLVDQGLMSRGSARNISEGIAGTTDPSKGFMDQIGLLDLTPMGAAYAGQEAYRDIEKADTAGEMIGPAVGFGLSVAEAIPVTKVITKPARNFLTNLSRKTTDITDPSRRDFVAGAVAFPGAAAGVFPFTEAVSKVAKSAPSIQPPDIKMLDSIVDTPTYKEFVDFFNLESMSPGFKQRATEGVPDSIYESVAEEAGNINKFLKSDIDNPYEFEGLKDSAVIIDELMEVYGMSKSEVKAYLKKEGILE